MFFDTILEEVRKVGNCWEFILKAFFDTILEEIVRVMEEFHEK